MTITIKRLAVRGAGKPEAKLSFDCPVQIIRGPSETGKSYVFACLWYMLGGSDVPKEIPPYGVGYDSVFLEFEDADGTHYTVARGLAGGGAAIYPCTLQELADKPFLELDVDLGALLVQLSGATGFQTMRSQSEKGNMTGDDFRYWALCPEIQLISEDPLSGSKRDVARTKHASALAVLLTGRDDSAIIPTRSKDERFMAKGGVEALQEALSRARGAIGADVVKAETEAALLRVDAALRRVTQQQDQRAKQLREIRQSIVVHATELGVNESRLGFSTETLARFTLLDEKYESDIERLVSLDEGVALFDALDTVPCPLCGAALDGHSHPAELGEVGPKQQRQAIRAETGKIEQLRKGLLVAISVETHRRDALAQSTSSARSMLQSAEALEKRVLADTKEEFSEDPSELALRRTELANTLRIFQEIETLTADIFRLNGLSKETRSPIVRDIAEEGARVSATVLKIVNAWGLEEILSVVFDAQGYDFKFNGRERTSYGKGVRGILTSAVNLSIMEHALTETNPHLGVVVIDSPLKAYADAESTETKDAPIETVRERMYKWLSEWTGPGQIVVIENERVPDGLLDKLRVHEFSGKAPSKRRGFYPVE